MVMMVTLQGVFGKGLDAVGEQRQCQEQDHDSHEYLSGEDAAQLTELAGDHLVLQLQSVEDPPIGSDFLATNCTSYVKRDFTYL
jgi:hypothetical protein